MLSACGGASNSANARSNANRPGENPNAPKTNVEELGLLVNIPYEAEDIVWKGGLQQKKVLAVLRFSTEDSKKLIADAEKVGVGEAASIAVETWFPDELTAQGDMSGDGMLKGSTYQATTFYQEPFISGKVTRIEGTDYFVLEMTAK